MLGLGFGKPRARGMSAYLRGPCCMLVDGKPCQGTVITVQPIRYTVDDTSGDLTACVSLCGAHARQLAAHLCGERSWRMVPASWFACPPEQVEYALDAGLDGRIVEAGAAASPSRTPRIRGA